MISWNSKLELRVLFAGARRPNCRPMVSCEVSLSSEFKQSREQQGAARSNNGQHGAATRSKEQQGAARNSKDQHGAARSGQEHQAAARSSKEQEGQQGQQGRFISVYLKSLSARI